METKTLVLIAYGRHDRGRLFPRTRRQIDSLKEPLQKLTGGLDTENYRLYHDGTDQAQETAVEIGLPYPAEECECDFLSCTRATPDEYDMSKAFRVVEREEQKNIVFVGDQAYVSHFARFYMERMQTKKKAPPGIVPCAALVIQADGTSQLVSPHD
jgi:hypothetical protein